MGTETLSHRCDSVHRGTQSRRTRIYRNMPRWMQRIFSQRFDAHSIRLTCKFCGTLRKEERHQQRQDPATCSHRHTDHRGSTACTRKTSSIDCRTYIDSVPRKIFTVIEATRSTSQNRNNELADRVSRDTTITKQQIDLATRVMMEQVSRLSDKDYELSMTVQLSLDCIDRATASSTAFALFHYNQTLNLRVVDPIADVVWAIIDDGCNCCCHGEVWRQNGGTKMMVLGLRPGCTERQ